MFRNVKALGLAIVATAAMSLAITSVAQATVFHATDPGPVVVFGEQIGALALSTDSGQIKCTQVLFESNTIASQGGQQVTVDELTLTPTITGCTAFGLGATVDTNGCKLTVTGTDTAGVEYQGNTVVVDITGCTAGKQIEVTTATCTLTIPEQNHLPHAVGTTNAGPPEDLEVHITLTGVKYEGHGACPSLPATTLTTNGQLVGTATFRARKDANSVQATHNGHQYQKFAQTGALVGLLGT